MKVLVAMSGGVDSSVAGALLLDAGHDVVGVTMRLWGGESDTGCCSVSDVDDARRVAQQLGIDHLVFNFGDDFTRHVVGPYVSAHAHGVTPNPCIECNRHLKFDRLIERAEVLGFDAIATGHHARIAAGGDPARHELRRGADRAKDQSYVVHMLDQHHLARTLFPVGELHKSDVRAIATRLGLRTAAKPDSQDVCFITSDGGREAFLGDRIPLRPAEVRDRSGRHLGTVPSIEMVTLGQRRGLALAGAPGRRYVVDIDHGAAVVTIGDEVDLLVDGETVGDLVWTDGAVTGEVLSDLRSSPLEMDLGTVGMSDDFSGMVQISHVKLAMRERLHGPALQDYAGSPEDAEIVWTGIRRGEEVRVARAGGLQFQMPDVPYAGGFLAEAHGDTLAYRREWWTGFTAYLQRMTSLLVLPTPPTRDAYWQLVPYASVDRMPPPPCLYNGPDWTGDVIHVGIAGQTYDNCVRTRDQVRADANAATFPIAGSDVSGNLRRLPHVMVYLRSGERIPRS